MIDFLALMYAIKMIPLLLDMFFSVLGLYVSDDPPSNSLVYQQLKNCHHLASAMSVASKSEVVGQEVDVMYA